MYTKKLQLEILLLKKGQPKMTKPLVVMVPRAGIEPAQPLRPRDFKSLFIYFDVLCFCLCKYYYLDSHCLFSYINPQGVVLSLL